MATPLASIFGSGFLVIVPILASALGPLAVLGMFAVSVVAIAVGEVIRFNIRNAESILAMPHCPASTLLLERISDFALVLAYIVSISLYLRILASFLLGVLGLDTTANENVLTTAVISLIVVIGVVRGLAELERLETLSLGFTVVIIAVVVGALFVYDLSAALGGSLTMPPLPPHGGWQAISILAGTLIVVQGFETSRYLGGEYSADARIRSSRQAQLLSSAVYLLFVALATPLMQFLDEPVKENDLIELVGRVFFALPVLVVGSAVLSQFSAAVADTIAGADNLAESTNARVSKPVGYTVMGVLAVALTWSVDTLLLVALASRAFALYYLLQCLVAVSVAKKSRQRAAILAVAFVLAFIVVFATPVG